MTDLVDRQRLRFDERTGGVERLCFEKTQCRFRRSKKILVATGIAVVGAKNGTVVVDVEALDDGHRGLAQPGHDLIGKDAFEHDESVAVELRSQSADINRRHRCLPQTRPWSIPGVTEALPQRAFVERENALCVDADTRPLHRPARRVAGTRRL